MSHKHHPHPKPEDKRFGKPLTEAERKPLEVGQEPEAVQEELPEPPATMPSYSLPRWRVSLAAQTPIAFPSLELEAADEAAAKAEFCRRNGITESTCPWTIERIG